MRRFPHLATLVAAFIALSILAPRPSEGALQLKISQVESASPQKEPVIALKAEGNTVLVTVLSGNYNCCSIADAALVVQGTKVEIHERNAGLECESLVPCYYDVTYAISRLAPGTYEISLFGEDSRLRAREKVEVGPIVQQSECIVEPPEKEKVFGSATRDSIVVEHRSVRVQCCLEFAPAIEIEGSKIRIVARDVSPAPCKCLCYFNLSVEIPGLAPGSYSLEYVDFDGTVTALGEFAIAPPRVWVTQSAIKRGVALPEKRTSVFADGQDVVVEYVPVVEQCCMDLDAWAELDPSRDPMALLIRTQDNGPPCDCVGPFVVRLRVLDLASGEYYVTCPFGGGARDVVRIGGEEVFFLRGFVSVDDWRITISDAIQILGHLFLGEPTDLPCYDAADTNDDGKLDLADAVYLLGYLFLGGSEPPQPFLPRPGLDPTADGLDCERVPCDSGKLAYETQPGAPWDFVEFCIPAGEEYQDEVSEIYPEVKFLPGSRGRIGCTSEQVLCIIEWRDVNRSKLCWLTGLDYIREIRGSHWE